MFAFTVVFFFFKQKTAYEMRISDWSSDVCSSDLLMLVQRRYQPIRGSGGRRVHYADVDRIDFAAGNGAEREHEKQRKEQPEEQGLPVPQKIGRASCREREWQYV